jgi:copper chaperone CopZ
MIKTVVPIRGMHCKACEVLIGEKLEEIKNIVKVKVSLKNKCAEINSSTPLDMELVTDAIREAGYEVGEDKPKSWISKSLNDYLDLGIAFLVLVVLFFVGSSLGLFNISVGGGNPSNLFIVLLIVFLLAILKNIRRQLHYRSSDLICISILGVSFHIFFLEG